MVATDNETAENRACGNGFRTTHWSVVVQAAQRGSTQSGLALEALCRAYWYPLYAYVRRQGYAPPDAQDLTQEFFSRLLAGNALATVQPRKGRFRSFLLAAMKHLLCNESKRRRRQKRGGGAQLFSLDAEGAEGRYCQEPADPATPDQAYEKRWAHAVLAQVLTRLRAEFVAASHESRFETLKPHLLGNREPAPTAAQATRLGLTVSGAKSAIYRMRRRYAEIFREEIARTVSRPEEVDEEIRCLFAALNA